ncbi:MAG: cysteine desulfurase [Bacteroidota bacterium]
MFHEATIRDAFPIFAQPKSKELVYLDNAATTQRPLVVVDAIRDFYLQDNANVHRANHRLARSAEGCLATVRSQVQAFLNASSSKEVVFTRGTTESLNLVAQAYGEHEVEEGDEVIVSIMEHHSNLLPWQRLCQKKKAHLQIAPMTSTGHIDVEKLSILLTKRTKVVAINYVSNVLGTIQPIKEIVRLAHKQGAVVVVDAAQSVPHLPIDVQALDCDFLAFSAHKMYGPTGIGVLYGKERHLAAMAPYQVGGGMVRSLPDNGYPGYEEPPYRFEAGTQHLAGLAGLGAALHFLEEVGYTLLQAHEKKLATTLYQALDDLPNVRLINPSVPDIAIAIFNVQGVHSLDVGMRLDAQNIAVRTGLFCAKPLMDALGEGQGAVRISCGMYNTVEEIEKVVTVLRSIS